MGEGDALEKRPFTKNRGDSLIDELLELYLSDEFQEEQKLGKSQSRSSSEDSKSHTRLPLKVKQV